jgi:hypothetical protein
MPQTTPENAGTSDDSIGRLLVGEELVVVIFMGIIILSGLAVIWMSMNSRRRIREMEHKERLAMIERGMMPPPEVDPAGFEQRLSRGPETEGTVRYRSAGIVLIGLGAALTLLLTFTAGALATGLGIGLAFAALGAAFLANAAMMSQSQKYMHRSSPPPFSSERREESKTNERP